MKIKFIKSARPCLLAMLLLFVFNFRADGQIRSFPDYFTYYNSADPNVPTGSDTASKAIMLSAKKTANGGKAGTLFLINTFRDDDTICACLAGHQMAAFFPNGIVAPGPFNGNFDLYMNYLGKDTLVVINDASYSLNRTTSFSKGVATGGELVAYYYDPLEPSVIPDIALVLLDKRQLPVSSYATLGYDFGNSNWETNQYYSINHPATYPQRIQDNFTFSRQDASRVEYTTNLPFSTGNGSSGGPLIKRPSGPGDAWYVRGLISGKYDADGGTLYDDLARTYLDYSTHTSFTKIATIATEIKRHCWKNRDSNEIILNGLQQKSVLIDNAANIAPYKQNRTVTQTSDITANAETGPARNDTKSSYLKANQCNLNGFTLTAIYPGSIESWQVTIAAKEIDLINEFSYTPVGHSELNLNTVVINDGTGSSLFRRADSPPPVADKIIHEAAPEFNVYPNPSPEGTFHIALPDTGPYSIAVYTMEGKKIYESNCTENPFLFQLSKLARGQYLLHVYRAGLTVPVFKTLIVY